MIVNVLIFYKIVGMKFCKIAYVCMHYKCYINVSVNVYCCLHYKIELLLLRQIKLHKYVKSEINCQSVHKRFYEPLKCEMLYKL